VVGLKLQYPAERAFRVNTLRTDGEEVLAKLSEVGVEAKSAASEMIVIDGPTGDLVPKLVAAGELTPQSRGSAAAVDVLDPQPGEHVLDLCAGPGIKTGQIAERMGNRGEVISFENEPRRAAEVAEQATRLGLRSVTVVESDATVGVPHGFHRVLLDPPCSDLGALASRPDARWRKSPATIERLVEVQARLLERAREAVRPGGTIVYSTCTISRRENEGVVGEAEESFQLRPDRDRTTGFFVARLKGDD